MVLQLYLTQIYALLIHVQYISNYHMIKTTMSPSQVGVNQATKGSRPRNNKNVNMQKVL
jgi:hypothetical protein